MARTYTTHTHHYGEHPSPAWNATHAACTICGFAAPLQLVRPLLLNRGATATVGLLNRLAIPFFPKVLR